MPPRFVSPMWRTAAGCHSARRSKGIIPGKEAGVRKKKSVDKDSNFEPSGSRFKSYRCTFIDLIGYKATTKRK